MGRAGHGERSLSLPTPGRSVMTMQYGRFSLKVDLYLRARPKLGLYAQCPTQTMLSFRNQHTAFFVRYSFVYVDDHVYLIANCNNIV